MKMAILDYAQEQARRDPRIGGGGGGGGGGNQSAKRRRPYQFETFSVVVNYEKVEAQPVHIDLVAPNYQFGLVLTDNAPATLEYQAENSIKRVSDLKQYAWRDMPASLEAALLQREASSSTSNSLVSEFGDLLCPKIALVSSNQPISSIEQSANAAPVLCPTGTLLSLPGSVMHAGPASDGFRAILFFSGWQPPPLPPDPNAIAMSSSAESSLSGGESHPEPYDPDTQYWASLLISDLTSSLWAIVPNDDGRIYLLTKLADAIELQDSGCKHMHKHVLDPTMQDFAKSIEEKLYQTTTTRDEFIAKFVKDNESSVEPRALSKFRARGQYVEKVSIDDLMVMSIECEYKFAQVYRIVNETKGTSTATTHLSVKYPVCLYFPADETLEGTDELEPYTLTMTPKKGGPFDGSNGVLRDSDGEKVNCRIGGKRKATMTLSAKESSMAANKKKLVRRK